MEQVAEAAGSEMAQEQSLEFRAIVASETVQHLSIMFVLALLNIKDNYSES